MLNQRPGLFLMLWLIVSSPVQADSQQGRILPRLHARTPQADIGSPPASTAKRPPIVLHVTRNMPVIHSAVVNPDDSSNNVDDPNPIYPRSALTVMKEQNTPQGLDISFVGPEQKIVTTTTDIYGGYDSDGVPANSDSSDDQPAPFTPIPNYPIRATNGSPYADFAAASYGVLPSFIHTEPGWGFTYGGVLPSYVQPGGTVPNPGGGTGDSYDSGDIYDNGDIYDRGGY